MNPSSPSRLPTLAEWPIRDLLDRYPETVTLLQPLGLDLCCGGGLPLAKAVKLHGGDPAKVMADLMELEPELEEYASA